MRHSQSHLISLATLLQSAEARHSATPPPPPPASRPEDDSGLIDILAMQRRAHEEREAAKTKTPVPTVSSVRGRETDPDFLAAAAGQRRARQRTIAAVAGSVALIALGLGLKSMLSEPAPVVREPTVVATPAPPPPAAPRVDPPAPPPVASAVAAAPVAAPDPPAAASAPSPKKHKGAHSSKAKGPKMTKVTSGGTGR